MKKIVAGLHISLDGVVETPENWSAAYFSPELGEAIGGMIGSADTMLLGRVTYETFAKSFAGESGGVADAMNGIAKYVVSGSLESADWQNSTLIKADGAAAKVAELKGQDGQGVVVSGSIELIRWLLAEGLLDELKLLVYPLAVGSGKRLFAHDGPKIPLKLISAQTFPNGVQFVTYAPAE